MIRLNTQQQQDELNKKHELDLSRFDWNTELNDNNMSRRLFCLHMNNDEGTRPSSKSTDYYYYYY